MSKDDVLLLINGIDNDIRSVKRMVDNRQSSALSMSSLPFLETLKELRLRMLEELGQITLNEIRNPKNV